MAVIGAQTRPTAPTLRAQARAPQNPSTLSEISRAYFIVDVLGCDRALTSPALALGVASKGLNQLSLSFIDAAQSVLDRYGPPPATFVPTEQFLS
eukprot:3403218-Rhodomonas_salina.2